MEFDIKNVTGSIHLIDTNYFESKGQHLHPEYGFSITPSNPIEILVSICLVDKDTKTVYSNIRTKSIHSFINKPSGKLNADEIEFLSKIAISNTNNLFVNFVFEDSNQQVSLILPTARDIYDSGKMSSPYMDN